jgi:hypothetical protein
MLSGSLALTAYTLCDTRRDKDSLLYFFPLSQPRNPSQSNLLLRNKVVQQMMGDPEPDMQRHRAFYTTY